MNDNEKKRTRRKERQPAKPLTEQQIVGLGEIFPGFDTWYRSLNKPPAQPPEPRNEVPDEL